MYQKRKTQEKQKQNPSADTDTQCLKVAQKATAQK